MKKYLYATLLATVACFTAVTAIASDEQNAKDSVSAIVKASAVLPKKDGDEFRKTLYEADEENVQFMHQIAQARTELYSILVAPDLINGPLLQNAKNYASLSMKQRKAWMMHLPQLPRS